MMFNTKDRYGSVSKWFHWVLFVLIATMLTAGFFLDGLPEDFKPIAYSGHKLTGLCILFLMLFRLVWRRMNVQPELPVGTKMWEHWAERLVHFSLYFFAIMMPLAGWFGASFAGRPPKLFGMIFALPVSPDKVWTDRMFELHGWIALILIGLVGIHVVAALFHHVVKKDNVLRRMMPGG